MTINTLETVYIGLGGNVGDVIANMSSALTLLDRENDISVASVSPVYKTPPWGNENQAWFHNCCAGLEMGIGPESFLELCLSTELKLRRVRAERWGPRTIDIDILLFGDRQIDQPGLVVPHPRMHERSFVLKPLFDIAPEIAVAGRRLDYWLDKQDCEQIFPIDLQSDWWRE